MGIGVKRYLSIQVAGKIRIFCSGNRVIVNRFSKDNRLADTFKEFIVVGVNYSFDGINIENGIKMFNFV